MNKYKCSKCGKIHLRNSDKKWIKHWCSKSYTNSRLILIIEEDPTDKDLTRN